MVAYPATATPSSWTNQNITLYHGTIQKNVTSILNGVTLTGIGQRYNDFGPGFYTTTMQRQAEAWASQRASQTGGQAAVVAFTLRRDNLAPLETLWFVRGAYDADDFWSLVFHCRSGGQDHGRTGGSRWYDVVVGSVAAFWQQRVALYDYDQMRFHTRKAFDVLNSADKGEV